MTGGLLQLKDLYYHGAKPDIKQARIAKSTDPKSIPNIILVRRRIAYK